MLSVPIDVIGLFLRAMTTPSLGRFARTCKRFSTMAKDKNIWEVKLGKDYGQYLKLMEEAYEGKLPDALSLYKDIYAFGFVKQNKIEHFSKMRNFPAIVLSMNSTYDYRHDIIHVMCSTPQIVSYALRKYPILNNRRFQCVEIASKNCNVPVLQLLVAFHDMGMTIVGSRVYHHLLSSPDHETFTSMVMFLERNCHHRETYEAYKRYGFVELEKFLSDKELSGAFKQYSLNQTAHSKDKASKLTAQDQASLLIQLLNRYDLEGVRLVSECLAKKMKRVKIDTSDVLTAANRQDKLKILLEVLPNSKESLAQAAINLMEKSPELAKLLIMAGADPNYEYNLVVGKAKPKPVSLLATANSAKNKDLVSLLLERGATNTNGTTSRALNRLVKE